MALEVKYLQQKIEENTCMCIIIILHCEIVQLLAESKKEIELLQEKITLLTVQLLTKEEINQKLIDTVTGTQCTCVIKPFHPYGLWEGGQHKRCLNTKKECKATPIIL